MLVFFYIPLKQMLLQDIMM